LGSGDINCIKALANFSVSSNNLTARQPHRRPLRYNLILPIPLPWFWEVGITELHASVLPTTL